MRLTGDGAGEQRLAGAGRAGQQHPVGHASAKAAVALGITQEVDDFREFGLRLVDPGDVVERDADLFRVHAARLRFPEATERPHAACALGGAFVEQHEQADDQQRRTEAEQDLLQQRLARGRRFRVDAHALFLQQR